MNDKIKKAVDKLNKEYGVGSVMTFDEKSKVKIERISSGSLGLDYALGGGWPKGRIIEITSWESAGKTTVALHAIAEVHKLGGIAAFIDVEHAFDPMYAQNLGVEVDNPKKFLFAQPMTGDEAIEIARELVLTRSIDLIIIDSVAAMIPKAELAGDAGDAKMGLQARLMSQAMRMLTGEMNKGKTTIIFLNQLRQKIGVIFGSDEVAPGGNALKFYASVRVDLRRIGQNKDGDEVVSNKTRAKVIKNKTAPPFRQAEFNIVFGKGIDIVAEVIEMAVDAEIVKKAGSWYSYEKTKLGQGLNGVQKIMDDNPELFNEIKTKLINLIK